MCFQVLQLGPMCPQGRSPRRRVADAGAGCCRNPWFQNTHPTQANRESLPELETWDQPSSSPCPSLHTVASWSSPLTASIRKWHTCLGQTSRSPKLAVEFTPPFQGNKELWARLWSSLRPVMLPVPPLPPPGFSLGLRALTRRSLYAAWSQLCSLPFLDLPQLIHPLPDFLSPSPEPVLTAPTKALLDAPLSWLEPLRVGVFSPTMPKLLQLLSSYFISSVAHQREEREV